MLRITPKEQDAKLTLALEGKLAGAWVAELAKAWSEWQGRVQPRDAVIDLRLVSFVDEAGRELLVQLHKEGCALLGSGCYVGPLVESILQGRETGAALLRWCWMVALGMAAATMATADPAPPLSLTLNQALQTALAQNPEIHRSLLEIAQSQEDRRTAASSLLPSVEADANGQRLKPNLDTSFGSPNPAYLHIPPYNWGIVDVQASMPLFDLSLWERWKAAKSGEQTAKAKAREAREQIAALVVGQYLRAQRATEAVKAAQSRVDLAQALEQLAEDQQKNGLGTKLDTLRAQVELRNEQQNLIQTNTQLQTARFGLVRLLNLDPATRVEVADSLAAPILPQFTFQEAYQTGLSQRPELASLDARERTQESLKDAARSLRLPSVVASASYGTTGLEGSTWVSTYSINLGVRVPLFTAGRISAQTARAQEEIAGIQEQRRGLKAQVGQEIQVAQAELSAEHNEVEVATEAVALASEALQQARHRFEAGISNNIEVVQAQDGLARATDNKINALYRLNQSRADLARAMGQLEPLFAR
ncbi:MAG: TolC family protein [Holophaga sp.]|nr:TolC family protein [Holophaga sp.]